MIKGEILFQLKNSHWSKLEQYLLLRHLLQVTRKKPEMVISSKEKTWNGDKGENCNLEFPSRTITVEVSHFIYDN